jgi:CRISPR type III-A-associated RAMP protein Csm4
MNPGLVVKLRPSGPWRIGPDSGARNRVDVIYHSDSLYSAVTSAMARLGWLEEWLDATARVGCSAVSFGSCFPFVDDTAYVVPPRTVWPPVSASARAVRIRWKSARFVPLTVVQSILAGKRLDENHWGVDGPSGCLVPIGRPGPFRTAVRWSAAVDRLTGVADRHSTACIEFRSGAGLWTVISYQDEAAEARWGDPVKAAFRLLADSGFGGERSRGWGRSETPEFIAGMLPDMILPLTKHAAMAAEPEETLEATAAVRAPAEIAPLTVAPAEPPASTPEPETSEPELAIEPPLEVETPTVEPVVADPAATENSESAAELAIEPPLEAETPTVELIAAAAAATENSEPATELAVEPPLEAETPTVEAIAATELGESAPELAIEPSAEAPVEVEMPGAQSPVAEPPATEPAEPAAPEPVVATSDPAAVAPALEPEPVAQHAPPEVVSPTQPHWLLSVFTPASTDTVDWRRGNYTVLARGGRVESPAGSGGLKKQIQMVAEGSVIYAEAAPRGSAADVAPDGFAHPVFRAGFALAIPLPEVI